MAKKKPKGKGHRGSEVKAPPKGSGGPPSVKAREDRAKSTRKPPPVKYGGKKKATKKPDWGDMPWPPKGASWVNPDAPRQPKIPKGAGRSQQGAVGRGRK